MLKRNGKLFSNLCWYLLLIFNGEVYRPSLSLSVGFFSVITMHLEGTAPHAFSPGISMNHWCPHPDPVSTRSCFVPRNLTTSHLSQIFLDGAFGVQIVQFHMHTSVRPNKSHPYTAALTHVFLRGCLLLPQPTFLSFQP